MDGILIDVGVYTSLEVDLSEFDFDGVTKVIMTGKCKFDNDIALNASLTPPKRTQSL